MEEWRSENENEREVEKVHDVMKYGWKIKVVQLKWGENLQNRN